MQIALHTLGCRLNEAELQSWAAGFLAHGCSLSENPATADVVVVNTCAVTAEAVRKSRQLIRRQRRTAIDAKLVISGCSAGLDDGELPAGIDMVIPNQHKGELVERVLAHFFPAHHTVISSGNNSAKDAARPVSHSLHLRSRCRAFIKVQDGCNHRCTFCIVQKMRGDERSRPLAEILTEINDAVAQGVKEVVLTGVHLGGYGSDSNTSLAVLVQHILQHTDVPRLRLGSLEPWDVPDNLLACFADVPQRMLPHVHLPLQSGCDRVLKRMGRRCRTRDFQRLVDTLISIHPHFTISTDIITGFPGESEAEWQEGKAFIVDLPLSHYHVFTYSQRQGTAAAKMSAQVPVQIKRQRAEELREISTRMMTATLAKQQGLHTTVLWETADMDGRRAGYTENYLKAVWQGQGMPAADTLATVSVQGIDADNQALLVSAVPGQADIV